MICSEIKILAAIERSSDLETRKHTKIGRGLFIDRSAG